MAKRFEINLECDNVAPLSHFRADFQVPKLRFSLLAYNGSGKTFLSRMFDLLSKGAVLDPKAIDDLITFGRNDASFRFGINKFDNENNATTIEEFRLDLQRDAVPSIPTSRFIYHVFNDEYVQHHVANIGYDLNGDIEIALGDINIDIATLRSLIDKKTSEKQALESIIRTRLATRVSELLGHVKWISNVIEYRLLTFDHLLASPSEQLPDHNFEAVRDGFTKLDSIPDDLRDIERFKPNPAESQCIGDALRLLRKIVVPKETSEKFRERLLQKEKFIQMGLGLLGGRSECPFCEREFGQKERELLTEYNNFINNEESALRNEIRDCQARIGKLKAWARGQNLESRSRANNFHEYATKYALSQEEFLPVKTEELEARLTQLDKMLSDKIANISRIPTFAETSSTIANEQVAYVEGAIADLDEKIARMNAAKDEKASKIREAKKQLCAECLKYLQHEFHTDLKTFKDLQTTIAEAGGELQTKQRQITEETRQKIYETAQTVLAGFFSGKYQLDKNDFILTHEGRHLNAGQAAKVLSTGEKSVIAFAYFLAETHLRAAAGSIDKLFLVIDDPISSMDFHHVYSAVGLIKSLSTLLGIESLKYIILTHSTEFLRILGSTNAVVKSLLMDRTTIRDGNEALSVPYVLHLLDIFDVAEGSPSKHTTGNSIRHILETLLHFNELDPSKDALPVYINKHFANQGKVTTSLLALAHDTSHGSWRGGDPPIRDEDYRQICAAIVAHVQNGHPGQIGFCRKQRANGTP